MRSAVTSTSIWNATAGPRKESLDAADPGAWLLLAAVTRLAIAACTLVSRSRPGLSRSAAFGGSVTASLVTGGVGLLALGSGTSSQAAWPATRPRG